MDEMKIIIRIIVSPFMFGILLVAHFTFVIKRLFGFIKYGGEASIYEKNELKTIQDIYKLIKSQQNDNIR